LQLDKVLDLGHRVLILVKIIVHLHHFHVLLDQTSTTLEILQFKNLNGPISTLLSVLYLVFSMDHVLKLVLAKASYKVVVLRTGFAMLTVLASPIFTTTLLSRSFRAFLVNGGSSILDFVDRQEHVILVFRFLNVNCIFLVINASLSKRHSVSIFLLFLVEDLVFLYIHIRIKLFYSNLVITALRRCLSAVTLTEALNYKRMTLSLELDVFHMIGSFVHLPQHCLLV
jgi:hypothetical protein